MYRYDAVKQLYALSFTAAMPSGISSSLFELLICKAILFFRQKTCFIIYHVSLITVFTWPKAVLLVLYQMPLPAPLHV